MYGLKSGLHIESALLLFYLP